MLPQSGGKGAANRRRIQPFLEIDHGARRGAGDSLDGLDFGNYKLPERPTSAASTRTITSYGPVRTSAVPTPRIRPSYLCLFRDLGSDENVSFDENHRIALPHLPVTAFYAPVPPG